MTIGQVAQKAGVAPSVIRYYEAAGPLPRPSRKHGARQYDDDAVVQLKILRSLRRAGISIRGLATITSQQRGSNVRHEAWLGVVERRIAELDTLMIEAQESKRRLEETIACRCEDNAKMCLVLRADGDVAG